MVIEDGTIDSPLHSLLQKDSRSLDRFYSMFISALYRNTVEKERFRFVLVGVNLLDFEKSVRFINSLDRLAFQIFNKREWSN